MSTTHHQHYDRPSDRDRGSRPSSRLDRYWPRPVGPRAPAASRSFWAATALVSGAGAAAFDAVAARSVLLAVPVAVVALVLGLGRQLNRTALDLTAYWPAVAAVSAVGAMLARGTRALAGVFTPAAWMAGVAAVAVAALVVLTLVLLWRRAERDPVPGRDPSRRREGLLWAGAGAVVMLGTALAAVVEVDLGLVHLVPALVYAALLWAVLRVDRLRLGRTATFGMLFLLTRLIGVSGAEWLARPAARGGVNLGEGTVALLAAVVALVLVAQAHQTHQSDEPDADPSR